MFYFQNHVCAIFVTEYRIKIQRITGFLDFFPLYGILENKKHNVLETGYVSILR
jgi:hypothetical protein